MPPKTSKNFSTSFQELEEITKWFDSEEQLDLDEGLKKFERGLKIAKEMKEKLSQVENQISEIKKKFTQ